MQRNQAAVSRPKEVGQPAALPAPIKAGPRAPGADQGAHHGPSNSGRSRIARSKKIIKKAGGARGPRNSRPDGELPPINWWHPRYFFLGGLTGCEKPSCSITRASSFHGVEGPKPRGPMHIVRPSSSFFRPNHPIAFEPFSGF